MKGGESVNDIENIYVEYFDTVYRYIYSLSHNKEIAEDITQETFFKALKAIERFDGGVKISVWLCQIAKNTYFSHYKKSKKAFNENNINTPDFTNNIENDYFNREKANCIYGLIHKLKDPYKEIFMLRVFGELSFRQIGELFGKTDSWARVIFYRAKKEIRRNIDENTM